MSVQRDSTLARLARASRPARPLIYVTVSPWWARVLIAAGAQPAPVDDSMTVDFSPSKTQQRGQQMAAPAQDTKRAAAVVRRNTDGRYVVRPQTYADGRIVGEYFRDGRTVLLDLRDTRNHDAKRLVDFAAGLIFGLHGSIERVESRVFQLTPLEVADEIDAEARELFLVEINHLREDVASSGSPSGMAVLHDARPNRKASA